MAVTGTYDVEARTPLGAMQVTLVLEENGNDLTGFVFQGDIRAEMEPGSSVDGNNFNAVAFLPTPMGKMKAKISGTVEGDTVSGRLQAAFGVVKFKGSRKA